MVIKSKGTNCPATMAKVEGNNRLDKLILLILWLTKPFHWIPLLIFRYLLTITLSLFAFKEAYASLQDYMSLVLEKCPNSNTLLIKKSLLELKNSTQCDAKFTKQLMNNCTGLNCTQIVENYKKNILGRTGSVVGEWIS